MKEWCAVYLHKPKFVLLYMLFNSLFTFTQLHGLSAERRKRRVDKYKRDLERRFRAHFNVGLQLLVGLRGKIVPFLEDVQTLVS